MALNLAEHTFTVLDHSEQGAYSNGRALVLVEPPIDTGETPGSTADTEVLRAAAASTLTLYKLASGTEGELRSVEFKGNVQYTETAGFDKENEVLTPGTIRNGTLIVVVGNPLKPEAPALTGAAEGSETVESLTDTVQVAEAGTPEQEQPAPLMSDFAIRAVRTFVSRVGEAPVTTEPTLASVR